jgi:hypothetical protein
VQHPTNLLTTLLGFFNSCSFTAVAINKVLDFLSAGKDSNDYQITPDLALNRRAGRKQ